MKKNLFLIIFAVFTCFLCTNNVDAKVCMYRNYEENVDFMLVSDSDILYAYPLNDFTVDGAHKYAGNTWGNLELYQDNRKIRGLKSTDECTKFMFYNEKAGFDKIYFSNIADLKAMEKIKPDLSFVKVSEYQQTPEKSILKNMTCTYQTSDPEASFDIKTITYRININSKNNTGSYELFANSISLYKKDFIKNDNEISYAKYGNQWVYIDNMHIRLFFNSETGQFSCPSNMYVGQKNKSGLFLDLKQREFVYSSETAKKMDSDSKIIKYDLEKYGSNITYDQVTEKQGEICTFSKPTSMETWEISLMENKYSDGTTSYIATKKDKPLNKVTIDVPSGIIYDSCDDLQTIYTNCLDKDDCKISTKKFDGSETLISNNKKNSEDHSTTVEFNNFLLGETYKRMVCSLSNKIKFLKDVNTSNLSSLSIYSDEGKLMGIYKINDLSCSDWGYFNGGSPFTDLSHEVENNILEIKNYCTDIYNLFIQSPDDKMVIARKNECIKFDEFYTSMIENGILNKLIVGCDFMSFELQEKLSWILNLIKIVGPILALGLGTLDFIKAVASGDADKEMKTAFKRFSTRIAAAALLFIIPLILAFLMDVFLGNQDGYNEDNPFCNIVEWK